MRHSAPISTLLCALIATSLCAQDRPSESKRRFDKWLERYPEADADGDGVLSANEARAARRKLQTRRSNRTAEPETDPAGPAPTYRNIAYGPHERNVLDFWQAESESPAPLIVYIHGGGFVAGDKSTAKAKPLLRESLDAGVSFAAINYRFREHAPIQEILRDAGRAVQFLRAKAAEWRIDPARIAAYGGSAGAGTSLWLAVHDDLADPQSTDPVSRESSRLIAAGFLNGQASYDILRWKEWTGVSIERFQSDVHSFYGLSGAGDLDTPLGRAVRADVDMAALVTPDDAPIFLYGSLPDAEPTVRAQLSHHPRHALTIKQRYDAAGVEAQLLLPKAGYPSEQDLDTALREFLFQHLKVRRPVGP